MHVCCGFDSILNLNFGFPSFGGRVAYMGVGLHGVRLGVSDFLRITFRFP